MAVLVTEIAIAAPFGNFHNSAVFCLIKQQRVPIHCGGGRYRWNPAAQQRKHHQRAS
jgi:hypothetical protein